MLLCLIGKFGFGIGFGFAPDPLLLPRVRSRGFGLACLRRGGGAALTSIVRSRLRTRTRIYSASCPKIIPINSPSPVKSSISITLDLHTS